MRAPNVFVSQGMSIRRKSQRHPLTSALAHDCFLQTCQLAPGWGAPAQAQGKQRGDPAAQERLMASPAAGGFL